MPKTTPSAAHWLLFVSRWMIVIGLLPNGLRKVMAFDVTAAMMGGAPPIMLEGRLFPAQEPLFYFPFPELFLAAAACFDILGALLILIGLKTRTVATFLAVYCVLAITIYHADINSAADVRAILRNLPLVGGLLLLSGVGAGGWSLDHWLQRRRAQPMASPAASTL